MFISKSGLILLLFFALPALAQKEDVITTLYSQHKFDEALARGWALQNDPLLAPVVNSTIGRVHCDQNRPDSALIYLNRAILLDNDKTWISGWAHAYKGTAWKQKGNVDSAIREYKTSIALEQTEHCVAYARKNLNRIQPEEVAWQKVPGNLIDYYFEDTATLPYGAARYTALHDTAFATLTRLFKPVLPRKFTMYVWNDAEKAKRMMGTSLGFTNPGICISHQHYRQTVGHEMMHAISYWIDGTPPVNTTKFVNEGVAVAFDLSKDTVIRYQAARDALRGAWFHSVAEIWQQPAVGSDIVYPVAGAFMVFLHARCTAAEYISILKNQEYAHAADALGKDRFNAIVSEFNNLVGLK